MEEIEELITEMEEIEELITEMEEIEEQGVRGEDDDEGFVEVLREMSAAERATWQKDVSPVKSALFKTRKISFKIIHSTTLLLPKWWEHVAGTKFEGRVLPRDVATAVAVTPTHNKWATA
ncbi:hypothetical protein FB446DRAFT_798891 [Lentinula raphanica]|nr:hypothetical protein FB446DRAFT_798891 [Lentinula raphanica]